MFSGSSRNDTAYVRAMPGAMARIAAVGRMKMRI